MTDLSDATDLEQIGMLIAFARQRLNHRDPPVARERVADQRAIARLENVERQIGARQQQRTPQRKD